MSHNNVSTVRREISIDQIRALQGREARDRSGLAFVEGVRFVAQAFRHRFCVETLVFAPALLTHPFSIALIHQQRTLGTPCIEVSSSVFESLSLSPEPQGIGAVIRQQWTPLGAARSFGHLAWIVLDTVRSPGNLGTILRTSEAVGAAGVIVLDPSVDPYHPGAVRASMAALYSLRFVRATLPEFLGWKKRNGVTIVGATPSAATDYHSFAYPRRVALYLGGERKGLSEERVALCDHTVRIPMTGKTDSLNLAIAASVLLYEVFNQRRAILGHSSLPNE